MDAGRFSLAASPCVGRERTKAKSASCGAQVLAIAQLGSSNRQVAGEEAIREGAERANVAPGKSVHMTSEWVASSAAPGFGDRARRRPTFPTLQRRLAGPPIESVHPKKTGAQSGPGATTTRGEWQAMAQPRTYRNDRQAARRQVSNIFHACVKR
ncbi:hypothetical protein BURKHO8Y_140533 [Burkholderia sp. 8Y]|nr:hypothetical protein BURKHO8Y_140533 [Burkholderia sp. 8Y]